jgi:WD40 repeat protein
LAFSPDGKLLANGGKGLEVRLSDATNGRTVRTITDVTGSGVAFSPDGKTFAVPDADRRNSLQLWDVATGSSKAVFDRRRGHRPRLRAVQPGRQNPGRLGFLG